MLTVSTCSVINNISLFRYLGPLRAVALVSEQKGEYYIPSNPLVVSVEFLRRRMQLPGWYVFVDVSPGVRLGVSISFGVRIVVVPTCPQKGRCRSISDWKECTIVVRVVHQELGFYFFNPAF